MFVNFCTLFICFAYKLADCFAINLILYECSFTSMVQITIYPHLCIKAFASEFYYSHKY